MVFVPCMRPTLEQNRRIKIYCGSLKQNWQMIAVYFAHLHWLHLLSNVFIQLLLDILLERKYSSIRIIIIYWISNVGAILCFILLQP
ncbi:hypothetical protein I4U23_016257 [Adineta vaga]|nr:hypothetical protein I4U23_016257 [Adineta vaga]